MTRSLGKLLTVVAAGVPVVPVPGDGIEVVGPVSPDPGAVLRALSAARPDVLLLRPADRAGLAVVRHARPTPVLVLTAPDAGELVVAAMRAGARGLLHEDAGPADLARAIRVVAGGAAVFGEDAAARLYARLTGPPPSLPDLTAREREVLGLLADDLGNLAIAARLNLAPKTVRNVVCGILAKFGTADRAIVGARAREAGLP
ncbi:LuxR C-terminal-related transcriptional regulator [Amycolatopsis nalaikhensis]|uniref:Response regulator transcription factor n=1 Tax=Amycolatopsis nalaikhensis TaxID=715472 RepID=A0ABY8X9G3_9PSEU|nr:response regulator transcription factor [Amycolatopsis sp. 2-2]WIV52570.1 response regulator transcription factor [Amycolatopsis sp. 2-2]